MRVALILNSDYNVDSSIGARAAPIAKLLEKPLIFSRNKHKETIQVLPFGASIMKYLSMIPILFFNKIDINPFKIWLFELFLLQKIKKYQKEIDIIHSWEFLPRVYAYVKKNTNIKIIQDVAIAIPEVLQKLPKKEPILLTKTPVYIKKAVKFVDTFIAPSPFVRDSLKMIGCKNIVVVPFGVDASKFKPVSTKDFSVAFAGNVNYRKGIPYLMRAWKKKTFKGTLHIYGHVYPEVMHLVKQKDVVVHGFCDIAKELPKHKVFCFPSLMEGSSKAVYEAMVCGLPVITTYNAGSVITDGKEGFIVPVQDEDAILDTLTTFANDAALREKMGRAARKTAQKYTWERYAKNVVGSYLNKDK